MTTPSKEQQDAEAAGRSKAGIQPGERAEALDIADDGVKSATPEPQTPETSAEPAKEPPKFIPNTKRDEIVARFRNQRSREVENRDEVDDFVRSGTPEEFKSPVPDLEPEEAPPLQPAQEEPPVQQAEPSAPEKFKVKVHGQERELTKEELIAKAQIALASENILDEVKALKRDLEHRVRSNPVQHPDQPGHHAAANGTQPEQLEPQQPPQDQEDEFKQLVEKIQFGDPTEARDLFEKTIKKTAASVVSNSLQEQRLADEGARTAQVLKEFEAQHQELANDPMANAAIERKIYDLQIADLKALGVDPARIPAPNGQVTPRIIAEAHRWYRAQGYNVSPPQKLLQTATDEFLAWKGTPRTEPSSEAAPGGKAPPRVEVKLDREQRRQAIPQQPSRTATPRPTTPAPASAQPRDRSSIVADMVKRRSLPRGRVVA